MHVTPKIDTAIIIHSQVGIELGLVIFLRQRVEIRLLYGKEKLFNETLVLRMHRTCRDGNTAVVVTEVIKNLVEHGHPILTLDDCSFEVVRHKDLRYSAYVP